VAGAIGILLAHPTAYTIVVRENAGEDNNFVGLGSLSGIKLEMPS
jgi:hypothetical protein